MDCKSGQSNSARQHIHLRIRRSLYTVSTVRVYFFFIHNQRRPVPHKTLSPGPSGWVTLGVTLTRTCLCLSALLDASICKQWWDSSPRTFPLRSGWRWPAPVRRPVSPTSSRFPWTRPKSGFRYMICGEEMSSTQWQAATRKEPHKLKEKKKTFSEPTVGKNLHNYRGKKLCSAKDWKLH